MAHLLRINEFANALKVTQWCVRRWILEQEFRLSTLATRYESLLAR